MMDNLNLTPEQRRRKVFAELLSQQGQQQQATEPYGAIAKVGSQLMGAYLKSKSTKDEQMVEDNRNKAYAAALKGDTSQVAQFDPKFALQLERGDVGTSNIREFQYLQKLKGEEHPDADFFKTKIQGVDTYERKKGELTARKQYGRGATYEEETGKQISRTQFEPERKALEQAAVGDIPEREKAEQQKLAGAESTSRLASTVVEDADRALNIVEKYGRLAVGVGSLTAVLPETPARELKAQIDSIKGNIGIDSLLRIKQSGAGLGQIPQSQLDMLAGLLGNLDTRQSPDEFTYTLRRIREEYADIVKRAKDDIKQTKQPQSRVMRFNLETGAFE